MPLGQINAAIARLRVGGFVPYSSVDCPGELAAVVFLQGCSWACDYCQNPHLRSFKKTGEESWERVLGALQERRGLLDMVIFSGGEPLAQIGLEEAMAQVRAMDFKVGLHSAGTSPRRLRAVLPACDWVGLDIKAMAPDYAALTHHANSGRMAWECLDLLLAAELRYEVRTTWHPQLMPLERLMELAEQLRARGVRYFRLQALRGRGCLRPELDDWPPAHLDAATQAELAAMFDDFSWRYAG